VRRGDASCTTHPGRFRDATEHFGGQQDEHVKILDINVVLFADFDVVIIVIFFIVIDLAVLVSLFVEPEPGFADRLYDVVKRIHPQGSLDPEDIPGYGRRHGQYQYRHLPDQRVNVNDFPAHHFSFGRDYQQRQYQHGRHEQRRHLRRYQRRHYQLRWYGGHQWYRGHDAGSPEVGPTDSESRPDDRHLRFRPDPPAWRI
jgi:hypothetical protein